MPVAGVVPYSHIDIDDEDSLSSRLNDNSVKKLIDIAVIRLPRISNFTDFVPFERYDNVSLRFIDSVSELGNPDMIILPGTKSTIMDLKWLRQQGLEASIQKSAAKGTLIFGICGGYQILGQKISDPSLVEASGIKEIYGMGLLDTETVFYGEKVQTQKTGFLTGICGILSDLNGMRYSGYEIHMGRNERNDPAIVCKDNVYGSYIHGIFDAPGISDTVLKAICDKRGIEFDTIKIFDVEGYKELQYSRLAEIIRSSLDMKFIYSGLNKGI